jgi:putative transcriptional regulator
MPNHCILEYMLAPGTGILLIADPFLKDPNFARTVVFLCEHQEEGSFGFVLNRLFDTTLDELIPDLAGHKIPVYFGGPVQLDTIHFLHQYPDLIPGSFEVSPGIYWGGEFEAVMELIKNETIDINKIRFYIGYSGWGVGQLDGELKEKSWITLKANRKLIFHRQMELIWKDSLRELGGDYEMMINFPIDPQLN